MTSNFPHQNHGTVIWDSCSTLSGLCLGGFHPLWQAFSGHFSLASEEEAGPLTLHLPHISMRDSVWTVPFSLAATKGIPFWFLFLPLLRCFRSGGSRSVREHVWEVPFRNPRFKGCMRLPEAVSRLAAPFFSSQAEPFSRQRGMSGPWWYLYRSDTIRGPGISGDWRLQAELVARKLLAYTPTPSNPSFMGALVQ